jgi:dTDP-4-dehydrorhamnose 3,5-epimerase
MIFAALPLSGAFAIDVELHNDDRGSFARTYCKQEFEARGLSALFVQCNTSYSAHKGTLRGMHFQAEPKPEAKLVRCTRGAAIDVIVDLRPKSPTFCKWVSVELTADNRRAIFVPAGFAHGFQTLVDETEIFYQMSEYYDEGLARGVRWNDPAFAIQWPIEPPILSQRDASFPDLKA